MMPDLVNRVFSISQQTDFQNIVLGVFKFQSEKNRVYGDFVRYLGIDPADVRRTEDIPFLPAGFFRNHRIITGSGSGKLVFESSGTGGGMTSRHYIADPEIYEMSYLRSFQLFYGDPSEYFIAALLPSYTERGNSSLVYMAAGLIGKSSFPQSGFYGKNIDELLKNIRKARAEKKKIILLGVSFALLDLAEKYSPDLSGVIVMETGGMKGRRREMIREELHTVLKKGFNVEKIHSEYGMTELLSQAYSEGDGLFRCPPWMRILIRDPRDPLCIMEETGQSGGINIIDLANIHSCSFIASDDLGKIDDSGSFEVLGRFDNSDIRGCNLLME
jgi:phenylacetate-coenzyme A ligase PaaK-like adenylate-forming protein